MVDPIVSERNRANALSRWARTPDRRAATAAATLGYLRKYLPDNWDEITDSATRARLLRSARQAHCAKMRLARARKRQAQAEDNAA